MGSVGAVRSRNGSLTGLQGLNTIRNSMLRDRTNSVDSAEVMRDAYFSNAAVLVATINRADGGRFDILNNTNNGDYGSILYTDSYGNEGDAYEVDWQRDYSDPERRRIQVIRFRHLQEGEW